MILLVLIASVLIAGVTVFQYKEQSRDYHEDRLGRKEDQIRQSITFALQRTTYPINTKNLALIFRDEIYRIAITEDANFNIYDLEGRLIKSSRPKFENDSVSLRLEPYVLDSLKHRLDKRYVEASAAAGYKYQASYSYITDSHFKPIGILNLPYFEENSFYDKELRQFLMRLGGVYLLMLLLAILLAYFISKYITRSLQTISDKLRETRLARTNEKILINDPSPEIAQLVESYNGMIDELELSAAKLARSEREQAWREMAKQVAHEIKNPLTPMRLSVQSFERKFDPSDPEVGQKVEEFCKTLIQQIDTLSSISSAFSNFAQMPAQQNENLNVVQVVKLALDIFNEPFIHFMAGEERVIARMDRTQLIRVITNLVKNAIQAVPEVEDPKILVSVASEGDMVKISVADNGKGIGEEFKDKVFEPRFTTKTSGMGLGLGMVKTIVETYRGSIDFTSQPGMGTVFTVRIPKTKSPIIQST
ncbi:sensor histidine kinase [Robiginitalea marina]|uniref:histidine kinase n=1 Tax=Robiginitalea marina TaxID=2954105 RepID=A0ABT1AXI7_9FLAO|nr:HAMP domain-containing sensor histidine kinase [Robiginitalea marina]MCO5724332.1 ATP-binding protein [Robiginitalea marina]